ncbi:MAG: bifunctional pantoate--beta-alanine ligase/(d)CMP kinase [Elainellaceae cyanobacterium]
MRWLTTTVELRQYLDFYRFSCVLEDGTLEQSSYPYEVGLVPTMGALHEGHLSLIRRARQDNDIVVVSIFVNPLQFGPSEDFSHYPRDRERDYKLCKQANVDVVFAPSPNEIYRTEYLSSITQVVPPLAMTQKLCGLSRSGHFRGVATIVLKLFNIVSPQRAYFGRKDAQQLAILQQMVQDLSCAVTIVPCPTVREADGLALSSRNQYLTPEERREAPLIYQALQAVAYKFEEGERSSAVLLDVARSVLGRASLLKVEYIDLIHPRTLALLETIKHTGLLAIAAHLGTTRLIDNVLLRGRRPIIAIDGPAGAGKSTVARRVARKLDLLYLDTGAMYRAVTWLALTAGVDVEDEAAIASLVNQSTIRLKSPEEVGQPVQVWINGQEVTQAIRTPEVAARVSTIAAQPVVRQELVLQQQHYGRQGGIAVDGRDIGTHVFPDAEVKVFLTASVHERARRRQQDMRQQGQTQLSLEDIEKSIHQRDHKDTTRAIAPLRKAPDAIEIQTDILSIDQVVDQIIELYRQQAD